MVKLKPLAALALLLLLAACTGWSDPYQMVSQGNELIRATERARIEQERAAELAAAQARDAASGLTWYIDTRWRSWIPLLRVK